MYNNLTNVKANKGKAMAIIDRKTLIKKVDNFVPGINIKNVNKDPNNIYQRQIQQTIQRCDLLAEKKVQ